MYERACERIAADEEEEYPARAVVLVTLERVLPVVSPGYAHVSDEAEMRARYRGLREERERAFEAHLEGR